MYADDHNREVKEIRGLQVCQNPECNARVNRDLNAATNGVFITFRSSSDRGAYSSGGDPVHSEPEVALLNIENSMMQSFLTWSGFWHLQQLARKPLPWRST